MPMPFENFPQMPRPTQAEESKEDSREEAAPIEITPQINPQSAPEVVSRTNSENKVENSEELSVFTEEEIRLAEAILSNEAAELWNEDLSREKKSDFFTKHPNMKKTLEVFELTDAVGKEMDSELWKGIWGEIVKEVQQQEAPKNIETREEPSDIHAHYEEKLNKINIKYEDDLDVLKDEYKKDGDLDWYTEQVSRLNESRSRQLQQAKREFENAMRPTNAANEEEY